MTVRMKLLLASVFGIAAMAVQPALAAVVVSESISNNLSPGPLLDFDGAYTAAGGTGPGDVVTPGSPVVIGAATVNFAPGSYLAEGSIGGVTAAPIVNSMIGADTGAYLAAEPGAPVTIAFSTPQNDFGLLWGSVDNYNTLAFYACNPAMAGCTAEYVMTGSGVTTTPVNGYQGYGGSSYVNLAFTGGENFSYVVASSSSPAFEFDFVSSGAPEPSTWAMLLVGFGALGFMLRGRRRALANLVTTA